ncbi:MAG: hypothetical protein FJ291_18130 [Planctomycetes bacterium]|nr:hypothetical protein [Planctomycetota bacterium]
MRDRGRLRESPAGAQLSFQATKRPCGRPRNWVRYVTGSFLRATGADVEPREADTADEMKDLDNLKPVDHAVIAKPHTPVYKMHRYFQAIITHSHADGSEMRAGATFTCLSRGVRAVPNVQVKVFRLVLE